MKARKWSGRWLSGELRDADDPFGRPFFRGQRVLARTCDIGIAVFAQAPSAIRYLNDLTELKDSCTGLRAAARPEEALNRLFDLAREELLAAKEEPSWSGEVVVPRGEPRFFHEVPVHVVTGASWLPEPGWIADNGFDEDGQPFMLWEKQALYAAMALRDDDFRQKTRKHEEFERNLKRRWSRDEYGRVASAQLQGLTRQFEALAHLTTVRVVEGFSSLPRYNAFLAKWIKKAKLPNPPSEAQLR